MQGRQLKGPMTSEGFSCLVDLRVSEVSRRHSLASHSQFACMYITLSVSECMHRQAHNQTHTHAQDKGDTAVDMAASTAQPASFQQLFPWSTIFVTNVFFWGGLVIKKGCKISSPHFTQQTLQEWRAAVLLHLGISG